MIRYIVELDRHVWLTPNGGSTPFIANACMFNAADRAERALAKVIDYPNACVVKVRVTVEEVPE